MYLNKSKCLCSNNCLHFLKCSVLLTSLSACLALNRAPWKRPWGWALSCRSPMAYTLGILSGTLRAPLACYRNLASAPWHIRMGAPYACTMRKRPWSVSLIWALGMGIWYCAPSLSSLRSELIIYLWVSTCVPIGHALTLGAVRHLAERHSAKWHTAERTQKNGNQ